MPISEATISKLQEDALVIASYQHIAELPIVIKEARGPYIVTVDDQELIDFTSGACTMNLGYDVLSSGDFASFPFPYACALNQTAYAKRLRAYYPGLNPMDVRVAFGVCGSDANDAAIKLCRAYTGRKKIVCFKGDYHGTTFGAVSMTTIPGRISDKFAPLVPEIYSLPFCDETADEEMIDETLLQLTYLDYEQIAGFIIETVQGDMGILPMHQRLMNNLYQIAQAWNIAFVVDEIQMAFYRTGPFFSIENYEGVIPDAILMGKHLGGGLPLSCVLGRADFMKALGPCEHAFSMAGNSEACARGLKSLDIIESEQFREVLDQNMMTLYEGLNTLARNHPSSVSHVTGIGFAFGLWLKSPSTQMTDNEAAFLTICKACELGLYTMRLGSNWLRIEPPLNIDTQVLQQGLKILDEALYALEKGEIDKEYLKWKFQDPE